MPHEVTSNRRGQHIHSRAGVTSGFGDSVVPHGSARKPGEVHSPEVVAICGISRSTIYEMIRRDEFPAPVKLGARAVGWRRSDIEAWYASRLAV